MCKILIIEEDKDIIDKMIFLLRNRISNISMILYTDNNENALSLYHVHFPDIIIINLDHMSNERIQTIEKIRNAHRDVKLLAASTASDFNNLTKIFKFGIDNCIMKPIEEQDFLSILQDCMQNIDKDKEKYNLTLSLQEKIEKMQPQLEQAIILKIVTKKNKEALLQDLSILNYTFKEGVILLMPITANTRIMHDVMEAIIKMGLTVISSSYYNFIIILIITNQSFSATTIKKLQSLKNEHNKLNFTMARGSIKYDVEKLHLSYEEALEEFSSFYKNQEKVNNDTYDSHIKGANDRIKRKAQHVFRNYIMSLDSYVKSYFWDIASQLSTFDSVTAIYLTSHFLEHFTDLLNYSFRTNLHINPSKQLKHTFSADHIYEYLSYQYNFLTTPLQTIKNNYAHALLRKAFHFIQKNHTNQQICLENLADYLQISTYYVCKLFQTYTNFTFIDCLNDNRIEHAKELLKTEQKIKNITPLVGFRSNTYFGRVFKEKVGITPKEYRIQYGFHFL